jgi:protoheme IX farnesyltransferase
MARMKSSGISPYISLMKLRVVELLLVTTLPALFLAAKGVPSLKVTVATLIGGTLAAGASNAFNMIIEVDSDRLMNRTAKRPLVTGAVSEQSAFLFASALTIISLTIFKLFTNTYATILTAAAIVFYVLGYTIGLKRRTAQNIVWGGIAGCMPVLIGWAAVSNNLPLSAWLFFLVIFFWTPPHFWALAIKYKDDYEAAGIPMLPVVATMKSVEKQMWWHTIGMVISSLGVNYTEHLPWWCWLITLVLAGGFVQQLLRIGQADGAKAAAKLFQWSITYLSAYSLLLVVAALLK